MPNTKKKSRSGRRGGNPAQAFLLALLLCVLAYQVLARISDEPAATSAAAASPSSPAVTTASREPTPTPEPTPEPTPTPTPLPTFEPAAVSGTEPEQFISGSDVMVDGTITENYAAPDPIDFGYGEEYSALDGVITFRGSNFRDGASFGTISPGSNSFGSAWSVETGSLQGADGTVWTGSGWTGQPLIVRWPAETKAAMNMYDWARADDSLVEVIYATMDGYVYFLDLETGKATRDRLNLGYTFKGAGALDPRGYPLLYLGAGYDSARGGSHVFVVSLIDGSILYEFGQYDGFAHRAWHKFDSSPLVDAETDTLIYPGESGVLYLVKLHSYFNVEEGVLSVTPELTKWRYASKRNMWLGMEDSAVIWRSHLIVADNGGNLMCLDLNSLQLDWVQDVLDDTNDSPVLELEDGHPYVYISTSFHYGWRSYTKATIPIWKIDAVTGEVVWHTDYSCRTVEDISGGVQGTIACGKNNLSDLIFAPVARTPGGSDGLLAALDKQTGEVVWEFQSAMYSWSSPVVVYDPNGDGYIIYCTTGGTMYLLDGRSGEMLDSRDMGGNMEASPAVFGNTVVVGTRSQFIWGVTLR
jgi:outer membrane protein assembly factor BamB